MSAPVKLIIESFLSDEERKSGVWRKVQEHLEAMLAKKRLENDNPKLTDVETATLRGHINCLKAFLALGKTPPEMTATNARPGARVDWSKQYG